MTTTLIVDADMLAYQATSATMEETEWEPWLWTYTNDLSASRRVFDGSLTRLAEAVDATALALAWSSDTNFRKALYGPYKAGRGRKPVGYWAFRKEVQDASEVIGLPCTSWERPGLEGDDVLGVLMTRPANNLGTLVLWSGDKDLKQIPGLHLDTKGTTPRVLEVTPAQADRVHAIQTLSGDATDGYPGCPGVGTTRAPLIVDAPHVLVKVQKEISRGPRKGQVEDRYEEEPTDDVWACIASYYAAAGLTPEDLLVQAQVARILRFTDYDFKRKEPIPWTPQS